MSAPTPQPEKQANITIEVAPDGLHIRAEYTGTLGSIPQALERLKAAGVLDLVAASRVALPIGNSPARKSNPPIDPIYQADGTPCCPVHKKALAEGRYGLYCPSKAKGDE